MFRCFGLHHFGQQRPIIISKFVPSCRKNVPQSFALASITEALGTVIFRDLLCGKILSHAVNQIPVRRAKTNFGLFGDHIRLSVFSHGPVFQHSQHSDEFELCQLASCFGVDNTVEYRNTMTGQGQFAVNRCKVRVVLLGRFDIQQRCHLNSSFIFQ